LDEHRWNVLLGNADSEYGTNHDEDSQDAEAFEEVFVFCNRVEDWLIEISTRGE